MITGYEQWNEIMCYHFFGNHNSNKIVYLYANEVLIKKLGSEIGILEEYALEDYCLSVRSYKRDINELFETAYTRGWKWYTQKAGGYPPFIAILGITVLAATKMEADSNNNIGGGNYYQPLRSLLGMVGTGMPRFFNKQKELWNILGCWQRDNNGIHGYTHVFEFGTKHTYCARSQCLIRETERDQLHDFFYWAGYKPGTPLDANILFDHLDTYLSSRVGRLANMFNQNERGLKEAITNIVLQEFKHWRGVLELTARNSNQNIKAIINRTKYKIYLVIEIIGPITREMKISFNANVDEEDIIINDDNIELHDIIKGFDFRNNSFRKYIQDEELMESNNFNSNIRNIELNFDGNEYFVFRKGNDLGISGLVGRTDFIVGQEHFILYHETIKHKLDNWIESNNLEWKIRNLKGIPNFWGFITVYIPDDIREFQVLNDKTPLRDGIVSVNFLDGLRIGNQEWHLNAPPSISITAPAKTTVFINNIEVFCLIDGSDKINLLHLNLSESATYTILLENFSKTIILRNDKIHQISTSNFIPTTTTGVSNGLLTLAGTYIYDNIDEIKDNFAIVGQTAEMIVDGIEVKKTIPKFVKGTPFDIDRTYDRIGITYMEVNKPLIGRKIDIFLEYLSLREEGNWDAFLKGLKWCFGENDVRLNAYKVRQILSQIGFVEFTRQADTNSFLWKVIPTSAAVLPGTDPLVYITGGRTRKMIENWKSLEIPGIVFLLSQPISELEPISICVLAKNSDWDRLDEFLKELSIPCNLGDDYFGFYLAKSLPTIYNLINNCIEFKEPSNDDWKVTYWDVHSHRWIANNSTRLKQYKNNYGNHFCILELRSRKKIKIDRDLGKVYLTSESKGNIFFYGDHLLKIRREYTLPEMYERSLVSCFGQCPINEGSYRIYYNVPLEVAWLIAYKMGSDLQYIN